jgi:hypothetical protein
MPDSNPPGDSTVAEGKLVSTGAAARLSLSERIM